MARRQYLLFIALIAACLYSCSVLSQPDTSKKKFLNAALNAASTDTERINILQDLIDVTPCTDAQAKLDYANTAKHLAEKNNWPSQVVIANRNSGSTYFMCLMDYDKAVACYENNVVIARSANDTTNEAIALEAIAKCYEEQEQHQKAFEYYGEILSLKPGVHIEMGVLADMGVTYSDIGDYPNALSCYIRSLTLLQSQKAKDIQDTLQRAGLLLNIGEIYLLMSRPGQAQENYSSVLKISKQVKDDNLEVWGLIGLGKVAKEQKNYDEAVKKFQDALDICNTINDGTDEVRILNELADTYLQQGIADKAATYARRALILAEDRNYTDPIPESYFTLGKIFLLQKQYNDAVIYLQKALDIYHKVGALDHEKNSWQALSNAYNGMNEPAKAFDAYKNYISIRDSVYSIAKANELTRMDLQFDFKRRQLADSLKQAGYYGKKIERQRILAYSSYTGLVLVMLLSFFIYRSYNIQKKYNVLLSKEKKRHLAHIEEQNNVLKDIAHIQSHDVRGPVATILGLTQLYNFDDPNDPINKEIVQGISTMTEELDVMIKEVIIIENKLRRKSMEDLP